MTVLVAYASKYGATQGIAERIASKLQALGRDVVVMPLSSVGDLDQYTAFVIGSSAYMGAWRKEAAKFVRNNVDDLAGRPVWLFSSGPLGTATTDAQGRDILVAAEPKEFTEFAESITPRDVQVFFGALDPTVLRGRDRLVRRMPAGADLLPEGDFRDWPAIDAWAESIAGDVSTR